MEVAPLFNDDAHRKLYLPEGTWYDLGEQQPVRGGVKIERKSVPLNRLPAYVRGVGIPLGPAMQYTGQQPVGSEVVCVYGFAPTVSPAKPGPAHFHCTKTTG